MKKRLFKIIATLSILIIIGIILFSYQQIKLYQKIKLYENRIQSEIIDLKEVLKKATQFKGYTIKINEYEWANIPPITVAISFNRKQDSPFRFSGYQSTNDGILLKEEHINAIKEIFLSNELKTYQLKENDCKFQPNIAIVFSYEEELEGFSNFRQKELFFSLSCNLVGVHQFLIANPNLGWHYFDVSPFRQELIEIIKEIFPNDPQVKALK